MKFRFIILILLNYFLIVKSNSEDNLDHLNLPNYIFQSENLLKNLEYELKNDSKPVLNLPEVKDLSKETKDDIVLKELKNGTFIRISDCLFFYQKGGSILFKSQPKNQTVIKKYFKFNHKPLKSNGNCSLNFEIPDSHLSLTFKLENSTDFDKLELNFTFEKNKRNFWKLSKLSSQLLSKSKRKNKYFIFNGNYIEIPLNFSYSCKEFSIQSNFTIKNNLKEELTLEMNNLQMQPFTSEKIFTESYDCSPLFTIGTWMGLLTLCFFTFIVLMGSFCLVNIKTMDRFENTKSKTITIPTSE